MKLFLMFYILWLQLLLWVGASLVAKCCYVEHFFVYGVSAA